MLHVHSSLNMSNSSGYFRNVYLNVLIIAFIYGVIRSFLNVLEEPTTFEETPRAYNATFPSLTICIRDGSPDNFTTFLDVEDYLNAFFEQKLDGYIKMFGLGVKTKVIDLKNASALKENFATDLDYVWEISTTLSSYGDHPITPCITLNVPYLDPPTQGNYLVSLTVKNDSRHLYYVKHDYKQSQHNYDIDRSISFQLVPAYKRHIEYLVQTDTTRLNTPRHECIGDNSMKMKDCIDEFIDEELHCDLPWAKKVNMKTCQSEEDLLAFRNLSYHMTSPYLTEKLTKKGCFKPNCKNTVWVKNQYAKLYIEDYDSTQIRIFIPSTAKVIQRKEIRLANVATFMADVGSYLGLFLGGSILSLIDIALTYVINVISQKRQVHPQ